MHLIFSCISFMTALGLFGRCLAISTSLIWVSWNSLIRPATVTGLTTVFVNFLNLVTLCFSWSFRNWTDKLFYGISRLFSSSEIWHFFTSLFSFLESMFLSFFISAIEPLTEDFIDSCIVISESFSYLFSSLSLFTSCMWPESVSFWNSELGEISNGFTSITLPFCSIFNTCFFGRSGDFSAAFTWYWSLEMSCLCLSVIFLSSDFLSLISAFFLSINSF